jgi:hypothetical protein
MREKFSTSERSTFLLVLLSVIVRLYRNNATARVLTVFTASAGRGGFYDWDTQEIKRRKR